MKFKKDQLVTCLIKDEYFFTCNNVREAAEVAKSGFDLTRLLFKLKLKEVKSLEKLTQTNFYLFHNQVERIHGQVGTILVYDKDENKYLVKFKMSSIWVGKESLKEIK